jgi:hypothetical protein
LVGNSFSIGDENPNTVVSTWIIRKMGGGSVDPPTPAVPTPFVQIRPSVEMDNLIEENALPKIGEIFSDYSSYTGELDYDTYYCVSVEISENKDGSITAVSTFVDRWKIEPASWSTTPTRMPPVSVEYITTNREDQIYRINGTSPNLVATPPANLDKSAADIGGIAALKGSRNGLPTNVPQVRIRVRLTTDIYTTGGNGLLDVVSAYKDFIGTRNDDVFLDFAAGSVVCDGFNIAKLEGPFYEIVFDFTYDSKFEHSQVPEFDTDGKPKENATGTEFSDVRWVRTSRPSKDFNEVFFSTSPGTEDADVRTIAENGWWIP